MIELPTNTTEQVQGDYTHRFYVTYADLTTGTSGTAQAVLLKTLSPGMLVAKVAVIVTQGFENTADAVLATAANTHTTASVGDNESATEYSAAAEINGLGLQSFSDGATNTNTTVTSATAAFTAADVGNGISGTGIPSGTTIASVQSATSVTLSAAATATATGVTISIVGRGPVLYQANSNTVPKAYQVADQLLLTVTPKSGTAVNALNQGGLTVLAQIVNLPDLE